MYVTEQIHERYNEVEICFEHTHLRKQKRVELGLQGVSENSILIINKETMKFGTYCC